MNNDTCNNLTEPEMHFAKRRQAQNATYSLILHMWYSEKENYRNRTNQWLSGSKMAYWWQNGSTGICFNNRIFCILIILAWVFAFVKTSVIVQQKWLILLYVNFQINVIFNGGKKKFLKVISIKFLFCGLDFCRILKTTCLSFLIFCPQDSRDCQLKSSYIHIHTQTYH